MGGLSSRRERRRRGYPWIPLFASASLLWGRGGTMACLRAVDDQFEALLGFCEGGWRREGETRRTGNDIVLVAKEKNQQARAGGLQAPGFAKIPHHFTFYVGWSTLSRLVSRVVRQLQLPIRDPYSCLFPLVSCRNKAVESNARNAGRRQPTVRAIDAYAWKSFGRRRSRGAILTFHSHDHLAAASRRRRQSKRPWRPTPAAAPFAKNSMMFLDNR